MRPFLFVLIVVFAAAAVKAEKMPENVVITNANEVYNFVDTPEGVVVKVVEQTQYEATRHSDLVVPSTFYNNDITLDKVSGGKPQYKSINSPNIFHDDSRVCYFPVELKSAGAKAKAEFRLTFKDAALLAKLPVSCGYPIAEKSIIFKIPPSLSGMELVERNFPDNKSTRTETVNADGSRVVTFVFKNLPERSTDVRAPNPLDCEPYILLKGYFKNLDDLYRYHSRMLDVDTVIPNIQTVLAEALSGATDRDTIIDSIYRYVQRKVRYVAYEEGEAGFRPDLPSEVLRKNYGDCKGMALLLATLLNRVGIEANIASIGTKRIPYKISEVPSLGSTNHMICIVPSATDTLFLDATYEYISSRDIPFSIQGKDAMMFTADGYKMINVPVRQCESSLEECVYEYEINDGALVGSGRQRLSGDMMEMVLTTLYGIDRNYKPDVLLAQIKPKRSTKVSKDSIRCGYIDNGIYEISSTALTDAGAVTDTGEAIYVDLSPDAETLVGRIDLTDRRSDYELPFPCKIVRKSTLVIPDGYKSGALPDNFRERCAGVELGCEFIEGDDGRISLIKTLTVDDVRIPFENIPDWNRIFAGWTEAANHQIELLKL